MADQNSSGEGRRVDTWPEQIWLGGDEGVAWRMWWDRPRDDMDHAAYVPVSELERVEGERDHWALESVPHWRALAEAAESRYEELRAGVEEEAKARRDTQAREEDRVYHFTRAIETIAELVDKKPDLLGYGGLLREAANYFKGLHDALPLSDPLAALPNQKDKGEPEPCDEDPDAPWLDEISVSIPPKNLRNVRVHKAPCETCGGSGEVLGLSFGRPFERKAAPCPTCTTEKQGEAGSAVDLGGGPETSTRPIELGEPLEPWAVAEDQEGVRWLTCHGLAVLDLDLTFKRIGERYAAPQPSVVEGEQ